MRLHIKQLIALLLFVFFGTQAYAVEPTTAYKASGPIEITSDSLEVHQQHNKAIFSGNVLAVQGEVKLKAERMTVLYKNNGEKKEKSASAITEVGQQNSIDKILVEKQVFLSTPQETASGAHGMYDVSGQKIYLNDNVVLTRDKNVLKGEKLVYDFASGKSELKSTNSGSGKQRVKALFANEEKDKNKTADTKK